MGVVMLAVAVAGFLTSFKITRVPPSGARAPFRLNPFGEVMDRNQAPAERPSAVADGDGDLLLLVPGRAVSNGSVAVRQRSAEADDLHVGLMVTCLAIGIGAGSMLAGRLSGDKVELGLGAARLHLHGRFLHRCCIASRGSYALSVVIAVAAGRGERPVHRAAERLSAAAQRERRKGPHHRHQQFLQHPRTAAGVRRASGLHDKLHVVRRTS